MFSPLKFDLSNTWLAIDCDCVQLQLWFTAQLHSINRNQLRVRNWIGQIWEARTCAIVNRFRWKFQNMVPTASSFSISNFSSFGSPQLSLQTKATWWIKKKHPVVSMNSCFLHHFLNNQVSCILQHELNLILKLDDYTILYQMYIYRMAVWIMYFLLSIKFSF